jgi:Na+/phosphate symporter
MPKEKMKLGFYWAASCGGCEIAVLDINEKILNTPSIALSQAEKEVLRMARITFEMLDKATSAIINDEKGAIEKVKENGENN